MIKCPVCKKRFEDNDMVVMDQINTLTHKACYHDPLYVVKDFGAYKNIKDSYSFFNK